MLLFECEAAGSRGLRSKADVRYVSYGTAGAANYPCILLTPGGAESLLDSLTTWCISLVWCPGLALGRCRLLRSPRSLPLPNVSDLGARNRSLNPKLLGVLNR